MKFTLRKKIILSAILPLLLLGASIIIIAATIVKGSIISKVEESLKGTAVATQAAYDQNAGSQGGEWCHLEGKLQHITVGDSGGHD